MSPTLLFFLKIAVAIQSLLLWLFKMPSNLGLLVKIVVGIWIGITLNLYIDLDNTF